MSAQMQVSVTFKVTDGALACDVETELLNLSAIIGDAVLVLEDADPEVTLAQTGLVYVNDTQAGAWSVHLIDPEVES